MILVSYLQGKPAEKERGHLNSGCKEEEREEIIICVNSSTTSTIKATAGEIRGVNSFATTADRKLVAKRKRPRLRRDDDEGKEAGKKAARKKYRYECSMLC